MCRYINYTTTPAERQPKITVKSSNSPTSSTPPGKEKKLLEQYRAAINLKHYSPRTGDTYIGWVKEFLYFHNPELKRHGVADRHPADMGAPETLS